MKKILVAEDDQILRETLEKKLSLEGYEVVTVLDGDAALEKVMSEKPDLLLLDIMMPGLDGVAVLEELRKDPWAKRLKIVMMSNLDYGVHAAEITEFEPAGYIMKANSRLEDILTKVDEILNPKEL